MNWIARIFSYNELQGRLADRDREINRLIEDNKDLKDRLFIKNGLPVSGAEVTTDKAESSPGWAPKKVRLAEYINAQQPLTAPALNEEELRMLREASQ